MPIKTLGTILGEYNALKAEVKRQSMFYQYELKCRAARHFGLTFEQVDISYHEWAKIRDKFLAEVS